MTTDQTWVVPLAAVANYYPYLDCESPVSVRVCVADLPNGGSPSCVEFELNPGPNYADEVPPELQGITFEEFWELARADSGRRLEIEGMAPPTG